MTTDQVFPLPDLGEGLTEAEILQWLVAEGDEIALNSPLVEVETAKAVVQIPSPFSGSVLHLHHDVGDVVSVGTALVTIGPGIVADPKKAIPTDPVSSRAEDGSRLEGATSPPTEEASGAVLVGYGTSGARARRGRVQPKLPRSTGDTFRRRGRSHPRATPLVRKIAAESGIDLSQVAEAGQRVTKQQLLASSGTPQVSDATGRRVPFSAMRRTIAETVTRSRSEIPEATTWVDVDATALVGLRRDLREQGLDVSTLALISRIVVDALERYPDLNARLAEDKQAIDYSSEVHLGIATSTNRGLVVPVVRNAHRMRTSQLSEAINTTTRAARNGELPPDQMRGSTFTVNNYGVLGVDAGNPIINYPEAGILGIGRIIPRPWVIDDKMAIRSITTLVLAFDHRICDGREAGGFLRAIADTVEDPRRAVAEW